MAVRQVSVYGDGHKSNAEVLHSVENDRADPWVSVLYRPAKAEKRNAANDECDDDEYKSITFSVALFADRSTYLNSGS